jgi:hypothetical protein
MRTFVLILAAVVLFGATAYSQATVLKYRVPLVLNEIDTVAGTESGGLGNGKCGWIFVGDDYVYAALTAQDSVNVQWAIDYADSAWGPQTGGSAKVTGFKTITAVAASDSMCTAVTAEWADHFGLLTRELRSPVTDVIPGAKWIRFRVKVPNVSSKMAASAADATVTLKVTRLARPK